MLRPEKIPVLAYTDDGRDVDDIEALAYLAGNEDTEIAGVVTTHMIPDRRAIIARAVLNGLGCGPVRIGVGSIFPIGKEDELLTAYLRGHTIKGRTYEGDGLIECFPDGVDVIHESIERYGSALQVAVLAPLTDLAKAADRDPVNFRRLGGLHIQGQAIVEDGRLLPDPAAYNLSEDMEAAERVFAFQDDIPFTLVGKHAAYQVPLTRADFDRYAATGHIVGSYLKTHAIRGLECFAERAPAVFERVFGVTPERIAELDELSKPYDALVAKAIAKPHGLTAVRVGRHALLGMSAAEPGIMPEDQAAVKADINNTILAALSR